MYNRFIKPRAALESKTLENGIATLVQKVRGEITILLMVEDKSGIVLMIFFQVVLNQSFNKAGEL